MPRPKPEDAQHLFLGVKDGNLVFNPPSDKLAAIPFCNFGPDLYLMVGPQGRSGWKLDEGDTVTVHAYGGLSITSACHKFWAFENDWRE